MGTPPLKALSRGIVALAILLTLQPAVAETEISAAEASTRARAFLACVGQAQVKLGEPFAKGSYWLFPSYAASGKRLSNIFVSLRTGEVIWPQVPEKKCQLVPKEKP
jgi:hypothetical protein